jgi:hypothetical protein
MLSDTYIRFTIPEEISEKHLDMIKLACESLTESYIIEDNQEFEILYFETDEGHSYEVPLSQDLTDSIVEAFETVLAPHFNNLTIEATGN